MMDCSVVGNPASKAAKRLNRQDAKTAKEKEVKGAIVIDLPDSSAFPQRSLGVLGVLAVQSLRSDPATTPQSIMSHNLYMFSRHGSDTDNQDRFEPAKQASGNSLSEFIRVSSV